MVLIAAGCAFTTAAVLLAYLFNDALPPDIHLWGVLSLAALSLGLYLIGAAVLLTARFKDGSVA
ncbi:MAG TPA: hypothetical protein VNE62_09595 [Actinomycetota bacterium]|nr:hypothetical protein [Actinomycetota bacterium]